MFRTSCFIIGFGAPDAREPRVYAAPSVAWTCLVIYSKPKPLSPQSSVAKSAMDCFDMFLWKFVHSMLWPVVCGVDKRNNVIFLPVVLSFTNLLSPLLSNWRFIYSATTCCCILLLQLTRFQSNIVIVQRIHLCFTPRQIIVSHTLISRA